MSTNNNGGIIGMRKARNDLLGDDDEGDQHSLIADTPTTQETLHMARPTDEELIKMEEKKLREIREEEEDDAGAQQPQVQQRQQPQEVQQPTPIATDNAAAAAAAAANDDDLKRDQSELLEKDKKPVDNVEVDTNRKETTVSDFPTTEAINAAKGGKSRQQQQQDDDNYLKSLKKEERESLRQPERATTSCFQPPPTIASRLSSGGASVDDDDPFSSSPSGPNLQEVRPGAVHVDREDHEMATQLYNSVANAKLAAAAGGATTATDNPTRTTTSFTNLIDMPEMADVLAPMPLPGTATTTNADGTTTTTTPPARVRVPSLPGAHRRSGLGSAGPTEHIQPLYKGGMHVLGRERSGGIDEDGEGDDDDGEGGTSNNNSNQRQQPANSSEQLVEPDPEQPPLMNAQVEAAPSKNEKQFPLRYKLAAGAGGVLVVVVIAIVVALVVGGGGETTEDEVMENNPTTTTTSPFVDLPPLDTVFPDLEELELIPLMTRQAIESQKIALPQVQAYQWLVQEDHTSMIQHGSPSQLRQRLALATIYYALDGPNWFRLDINDTWLDYDTHECSWFSSSQSSPWTNSSFQGGGGGPCGDAYVPTENPWDEHVDYKLLDLSGIDPLSTAGGANPNLKGTLVPELAMLTSLEGLDVSYQKVTGTIPTVLTELSSTLRSIRLNDCFFTGTIPDAIYEFPQQLWLGNNGKLEEGTIPTTIGLNPHFTQLTLVDTNRVGTIPSQIGLLSSAGLVDLSNNLLTGQLPIDLGRLTKLQHLVLSQNFFTGALPTTLSLLFNLRSLVANRNPSLSWQLVPELFISPINGIDATWTYVNGSWPYLTELMLGQTGLGGTIPSEIGLLTSLKVLELQFNQLHGQLPSQLGLLPSLEEINVANNDDPGITGPVPQELSCDLLARGTPEC